MSGTQVQKVSSVGVFSASSRCSSVIGPVLPPESLGVQPLSVNAATAAIEVIATAALRAPCLIIGLLSLVLVG